MIVVSVNYPDPDPDPLSVVIMSPSLAATTDSRFVSYRYNLRKRTETPEIKCSTKI